METVLTTKTAEQKELRLRVLRLAEATEHFNKIKEQYEEEKKNINRVLQTYFEKNGYSKALLQGENEDINLTLVQPRSIDWDLEALKKVIDNDIIKEVIDREIVITDFDGLKQLLKKHGIKAREFKKYIEVREELNTEALDNLVQCGWIDRKQLKGTYKIKAGTEYIRMTRKKKTEG